MYLEIRNILKLKENWRYYGHIGVNNIHYDIVRMYNGDKVHIRLYRHSMKDERGNYFEMYISTISFDDVDLQTHLIPGKAIRLDDIRDIHKFNNLLWDMISDEVTDNTV
jgi:hypothetical protein